jgi:hypothetical protein
MACQNYFGQDYISAILAISTVLGEKLDANDLNFLAGLLQLASQQLYAIAAGRVLFECSSQDNADDKAGK